jgi:hypothetical protein
MADILRHGAELHIVPETASSYDSQLHNATMD